MSQRPIARSPDLSKLRNEGFDIRMVEGYLVVRDVPYLRARNEIARGVLACAISAADDVCNPPGDHTAYFVGDHPCNADGTPMIEIVHSPSAVVISETITANYYLSARPKPRDRYVDFHEKVTTYIRRLSGPAEDVRPDVTAKTFPFVPTEDDDDSVFHYTDLATSRSDTGEVSRKMKLGKIGVLGLGGTGGYILDFVAKTPVAEIHLFDGDVFSQHNAFRAPGAASGADLQQRPLKVDYLHGIYSRMRKGIIAHREFISEANLNLLDGMDFVFLSMEAGPVKAQVIERLLAQGTPFIDVGMGVYLRNGALGGTLRVTVGTAGKHDHLAELLPLSDGGLKNEYDKNIQIAELNAMNAALAVIRWKKLFGFYADQRHEHYSTYSITRNETNNEEQA